MQLKPLLIKRLLINFLILNGLLFTSHTYAQNTSSKSIQTIIAAIDTFNYRLLAEKLYLQLDKSCYTTQDTIWLKAYLFDSATHYYSALSGILYIELINDSNKVVQRISLRVKYGLCVGQIALNTLQLTEGGYTIRAYTNWMQNFGPTYFFNTRIYIGNLSQNLLVAESHTLTDKAGDRSLKLSLQFSKADKQPYMLHDMQLRIIDKKRTLYKGLATTTLNGLIETNFTLPQQPFNSFLIIAEDKQDNKIRVEIPVVIHDQRNIDVQFMPEGGHLVAGLASCVAFKALGDDGLGTEIHGIIVNSKNDQICGFAALHKGMGTFNFTPLAGETYKAVVDVSGGEKKDYPLPEVQSSGIVLHVVNDDANDSLRISIQVSVPLINGQVYHLLGLSRGIVCYAANLVLNKKEIHINIAKRLFPSGIAHLTIFNPDCSPVNERLIFINHHDNLNILVATNKANYTAYDSVALHIKVTDKNGKPISGSFSLAVTNDALVKADNGTNILTQILLTSDLQGSVEDPAFYFGPANNLAAITLDNLLLTQGWVDYQWDKILKPIKKPVYDPEPEFMITGTVTGTFNKPVNQARVSLISTGKYTIHKDTSTNILGKFSFRNLPLTDTSGFVLQALSPKGKSAGLGIVADEFSPPPIAIDYKKPIMPWYVNADTTSLNYINNNLAIQKEIDKHHNVGGSKMLNEVKITDKKIIKGSYNLNGPGQADQILDEQDIAKENKITLLDLLYKRVKGFHIGPFPPQSRSLSFNIYNKQVNILMDGVELDRSLGKEFPGGRLDYMTQFLKEYTAEDIKGIEVMYSSQFNYNYSIEFITPELLIDFRYPTMIDWAYIEITTKSGHGLYMRHTPGITTYKPLPVTMPMQFYKPKYKINRTPDTTISRSTIHWESNIITNKQGEANVWFYTGGQAVGYTLILQGADMFGSLGYKTATIKIKK